MRMAYCNWLFFFLGQAMPAFSHGPPPMGGKKKGAVRALRWSIEKTPETGKHASCKSATLGDTNASNWTPARTMYLPLHPLYPLCPLYRPTLYTFYHLPIWGQGPYGSGPFAVRRRGHAWGAGPSECCTLGPQKSRPGKMRRVHTFSTRIFTIVADRSEVCIYIYIYISYIYIYKNIYYFVFLAGLRTPDPPPMYICIYCVFIYIYMSVPD